MIMKGKQSINSKKNNYETNKYTDRILVRLFFTIVIITMLYCVMTVMK